jgi:hypothetical protein
MHDDKEIAIQIIPEAAQADTVECEEMQFVMIKVWNPDTWTLSEPFELWVPKMGSLLDFSAILSSKTHIAAENIDCAKIISPWNFHRVELPFINWVRLSSEEQGKNSISQDPFYLSTDGILFIVKDRTVNSRDMTPEEKELYKCQEYEEWLMSGGAKGQYTEAKGKNKK